VIRNSKGFGLIVLLILFSVGIVAYFGYQYWQAYSAHSFDECIRLKSSTVEGNEAGNFCTTKDNKRFLQPLSTSQKLSLIKAHIEGEIKPALELYFYENKSYPATLPQLVPKYLVQLPLNPLTNEIYSYKVNGNMSNYIVSVKLEDGSVYEVNAPK
jgi:hypothetical protein